MKPEISVLLPVYNGEKYLEEALESMYTQSIKNIEINTWFQNPIRLSKKH